MRIIDSVSDFPAAIAQNAHPLHVDAPLSIEGAAEIYMRRNRI